VEVVEALKAFVAGEPLPEHGQFTSQMSAFYIDEWWPAAVRLDQNTYFIRADDDAPGPDIAPDLTKLLSEAGLSLMEGDWPLVESVSLQRLGVLFAHWQVWARDVSQAEASIGEAVMDTQPGA